jgi:hypothetical protein
MSKSASSFLDSVVILSVWSISPSSLSIYMSMAIMRLSIGFSPLVSPWSSPIVHPSFFFLSLTLFPL